MDELDRLLIAQAKADREPKRYTPKPQPKRTRSRDPEVALYYKRSEYNHLMGNPRGIR